MSHMECHQNLIISLLYIYSRVTSVTRSNLWIPDLVTRLIGHYQL
jgi:hypothetical protein